MGNLCRRCKKTQHEILKDKISASCAETETSMKQMELKLAHLQVEQVSLETEGGKRTCERLIAENTELLSRDRARLESARLLAYSVFRERITNDTTIVFYEDAIWPSGVDIATDDNKNACVVCLENEKKCAVVPCGHQCLCFKCSDVNRLERKCPMCRGAVEKIIPIYQS